MMRVLVWGAPDLPYISATTRGWISMKFRNTRVTTALAAFGLFIALAGLVAPTALGAAGNTFRFVTQPADATRNATITSSDFVSGNNFVQVELIDSAGVRVTNSKLVVTFTLETGPGLATGSLSVTPQPLINGVATFGTGTLSIGSLNEPQFTSFALVPKNTKGSPTSGPASNRFDIWEDGDTCSGGTDTCEASLRGGEDQYTLSAGGTLGASELSSSLLPGLTCPGQAVVFANSVFSHATTEPGTSLAPVFLSNHITAADWKASANNGQAHADWCVGLKTADPWLANGGTFTEQDVNGDAPGGVLFVGLAPRCPSKNAQNFAPCVVSRTGDGADGSIAVGWLPGGDPPRRT
jgi:hypothetical protein